MISTPSLPDNTFKAADDALPAAPLTFAELRRQNPQLHKPIIDGLLRRGEVANLVSHPKVGKSWAVYDLALSVVTGRRWLGRFPTASGKVLLVDNELHPATLADRIPIVASHRNIDPHDYEDNLTVLPLRGQSCDIEQLEPLIASWPKGEFGLIVIDALYRCLPHRTSENDNAAIAEVYNCLDRYAEQAGAAVLIVHHASKGHQSDRRATDVGSGAGSQSRAADAHIVLREHETENVAVMHASVRSFEPVKPVCVEWRFPCWDVSDAHDPNSLRQPKTRGDVRQQQMNRDAVEKVRNALARLHRDEKPGTRSALNTLTGMSKGRIGKALEALEEAGEVTSVPGQVRGNEATVYTLTASPSEG